MLIFIEGELMINNKAFLKGKNIREIYCLFSFSIFLFLIDISVYKVFIHNNIQQYWILTPLCIYFLLSIIENKVNRLKYISVSLELSNIFSFLLFSISVCVNCFNSFVNTHYEILSGIIILCLFMNFEISKKSVINTENCIKIERSMQLFNLFYLNTSKAHEIAMLIDNKIMKNIEKEQISEEVTKYNIGINFAPKGISSTDVGYSMQDSSKKRVYENFDVKTTKSIMLRKLYETAKKIDHTCESILKLNEGDLVLIKDIELKQRNVDDTVMLLNILKDSNFKTQANNDVEININKMMETILKDFTIDYVFKLYCTEVGEASSSKNYIIQIPYYSMENFENGYLHNDLQLGKLSLIGIYRGEINFSERESISSKFLELISASFHQDGHTAKSMEVEMKLSAEVDKDYSDFPFSFEHNRLTGKMHLVDVIAIIQELNLNKDE